MSEYLGCPGCKKLVKPTASGKWRKHTVMGRKEDCDFSGTVIQEEECQSDLSSTPATSETASSATSPPDDVKESAEHAISSTPSSPATQEEAADASTTAPANPALPGVTEYAEELNRTADSQLADYKAKIEENLTQSEFSQPIEDPPPQPMLFSQPVGGPLSEEPPAEMTDLGKELTARFKEMFYAYDNRRTDDNRSAQTTMGPSEMGTPCDRRLALSLMRMPAVNPGGDGWAAFVGTCIHAGLADMFLWANHGTGRFAVETELKYDSKIVPKGTADLIDRTLFMMDDHKCQGRWSRNKLKSQGPIPTYRTQVHVYAHGARQKGEKIDHVAIISWPRDESTLDDLYVWTEPYNPLIVQKAFERVERVAEEVEAKQAELVKEYKVPAKEKRQLLQIKARVSQDYDVDSNECRFCPFSLPGARTIMQGCNGKR